MFVYMIRSGEYSDRREDYLTHETEITKEKFEILFTKSTNDLLQELREKKSKDAHRVSVGITEITDRMCEDHGFKYLKIDVEIKTMHDCLDMEPYIE